MDNLKWDDTIPQWVLDIVPQRNIDLLEEKQCIVGSNEVNYFVLERIDGKVKFREL